MKTQPRQHISNTYNTCTVVTSPVYIGSKFLTTRKSSLSGWVPFSVFVFHSDLAGCYDLALVPSIICLGRFRIACRYIYIYIQSLTITSGNRLFGSVVRALDFHPDRPGSNPKISGIFFSYASFLSFDFNVVRCGLVRNWNLFRQKWLRVNINNGFREKGECYDLALVPSIICLGRLRIACRYIFNLWQLCQGVKSSAQ